MSIVQNPTLSLADDVAVTGSVLAKRNAGHSRRTLVWRGIA